MQSLMWEEFVDSNVDCYMKTSPQLLCTKVKEERVRAIVGKSFSVPVWFSTSGLVPYCFAQMLQEKEGVRGKKGVVRTLLKQDDS